MSSDFVFSKVVQNTILTALSVAIPGAQIVLGVRMSIFLGSSALTWIASEYTDDALRDAIEWTLTEGGDEVTERISEIQSYAYNGDLVEQATLVAKRLAPKGVWRTVGEVFNRITGKTEELKERQLDIRLPLLQDRGGATVEVNSYTRNGHGIRAHERSWPDGDTGNNLRQ